MSCRKGGLKKPLLRTSSLIFGPHPNARKTSLTFSCDVLPSSFCDLCGRPGRGAAQHSNVRKYGKSRGRNGTAKCSDGTGDCKESDRRGGALSRMNLK